LWLDNLLKGFDPALSFFLVLFHLDNAGFLCVKLVAEQLIFSFDLLEIISRSIYDFL
jgi:hypothetical protein